MQATTAAMLKADDLCKQCGHAWNDHKLLTDKDPPVEGWMECPVAGCTCRFTWSLPAPFETDEITKAAEYVLKKNDEFYRRLA
jgi:hypothetical protein